MASLLDIVPASASVDVGGVSVSVSGITAKGIGSLLGRFPDIQSALTGEGIMAEKLISLAPDAVAAIIAAGCGAPGNADHEAAAAGLPIGAQVDLLSAIITATLPRGVGPLVDQVKALSGNLGLSNTDQGSKSSDTNSPSPSNG
jgi:hypothetical protein